VAVELAVTLDDLHPAIDGQRESVVSFGVAGCYPRNELMVLGTIQYSDLFDRLAYFSSYFPHPIPEREV